MAWNVTTEWDDIHRKLGNLPELPKTETLEEATDKVVAAAEQVNPHEHKTLEQLDEEEDDLEEEIFRKYREQRLQELRAAALKPRFGSLLEISRPDYVAEVNEAPKDVMVILHLYQDYLPLCKRLNSILVELSRKFLHHKFIKIRATDCNQDFPDSDCPTLLIYQNGSIFTQLNSCAAMMGGGQMTEDTVEWVLAKFNVLETELEENPVHSKSSVRRAHRQREDRSDSDEDDREYSSNQLPRYRR